MVKSIFEEANCSDDEDTCQDFELQQLFQQKFNILDEHSVSLGNDYVLNLCSDKGFTRVLAGLSNGSVQLFDISSEVGLKPLVIDFIPTPPSPSPQTPICICGVRFLDETPNCLLVGTTTNGLVRLFDLRTQKEEAKFVSQATVGQDQGKVKSITCFDSNANSRVICTGTDQKENCVYLLFHDVRQRKQMGGYFESHNDDITSVRFHDNNPDFMCSGSTDGLINIFNIEGPEDDALLTTINTESSVHKLNWHRNPIEDKDLVSCITHLNDFMMYECEEGDAVAEFSRNEVTSAMKRKNVSNSNIIDAHNMQDGNVQLLAGTNFNKGDILRSMQLQNKKLQPLANFSGNKQIVRSSIYDAKTQTTLTAGESGIVSLWTPFGGDNRETSSSTKIKTKLKSKKSAAPY